MNVNEAFIRALHYITSLTSFCILVGLFSFISTFLVDDVQLCSRLEGVTLICAIISVGSIGFLSSFIDQDYVDEIRKEIEKLKENNKED